METPDWKKFEQLAAAIQRELAPDAKITENAKLVGKSGSKRQIDILIEEETGQFKLRIAIECKDYKNPVDIKDVETFLGLLSDVGAHKGAMVAANGFTAAARERALNAGQLRVFGVIHWPWWVAALPLEYGVIYCLYMTIDGALYRAGLKKIGGYARFTSNVD